MLIALVRFSPVSGWSGDGRAGKRANHPLPQSTGKFWNGNQPFLGFVTDFRIGFDFVDFGGPGWPN